MRVRRRSVARVFAARLAAGSLVCLPGVAAGQRATPAPTASAAAPAEPSVAELKQKANEAMLSLHPADALDGYRRAYELSGEAALLYNMGRALEALQDYPSALAQYEEFGRKATADLKARVHFDELMADARLKVAHVTFTSRVTGARVLFRDKAVGVIPASGRLDLPLNAGPGHVEIDADGYGPFVRNVQLPAGGVLSVEADLLPTDRAGVLAVATTPAGADIAVDGKEVGASPIESSVTAGMHTIAIRRSGFVSVESSIVVAAHERKTVAFKLEATPLLVSRWWFWTGVALVAAGGVAITYAALTERAPDKGTISPGVQRVLSLHF